MSNPLSGRRLASLAVCALLCVGLAAPFAAARTRTDHDPAATHAALGSSPAPAATVAFGLRMLRALGGQGNLVFSPDSLEAALAMTGTGAGGTTAQQMAAALGLNDPAAFPSVGRLQQTLLAEQAHAGAASHNGPTLEIANGLFVARGFTLRHPFLATLASSFTAAPQSVDFRAPQAVQAINAFVDRHTDGVIPSAVQSLDPTTLLALVNALYLKARWQSQFNKSLTAPAPFATLGGTVNVGFMHQTEEIPYDQTGSYTAVELGYRSSTLSLLLLLPAPGRTVATVVSELNPTTLAGIVAHLTPTDVAVSLPRFHIVTSTSVIGQLQSLGMTDAFDPLRADFLNIAAGGGHRLVIGAVDHVANFTVDEGGTVAAASTVVGLVPTVVERTVPFDADRPFLFFLRDDATGALLFAGRVADPASAAPGA